MITIFSSKFAPVMALTILVSFAPVLRADLGGDNPTGTSGQYNGNITTGCSYDPYTGNATRSITDLVVAGGVGTYPLAFTRTMNSRYTVGVVGNAPAFGSAGTWTFNYQWSIDKVTVVKTGSIGLPASYNINYPDGRRVIFSNTGTSDPDFRGPKGVRDRLEKLATGGAECYLRLIDGGKIWFHANISTTTSGNQYTSVYTFSLKGIIDPYGQTTTITYPADGSLTITEPAGRTIKIFSRAISSTSQGAVGDVVVDHVTGSDGRTVQYNYTAYVTAGGTRYTSLTSVVYFGDTSLNATYTYQPGNTDPNGRPLIATCIDPMFDGPMWKIAYDFAPSAAGVVYGQLLREKHPNGTPISTLTVTGTTTRTETRGDNPTGGGNPTRTFTYNKYRLTATSDFKGINEVTDYDSNFYLQAITDRAGNATQFSSNSLTGNVKRIIFPLPGDVVPSTAPAARIDYMYGNASSNDPNNRDANNPYYLSWIEDDHGHASQIFFRDSTAKMQISSISYPVYNHQGTISYYLGEAFTYNNFGQVLTHTLRNSATESYTYDTSGRATAYFDAAHPTSGSPTTRFQYDSFGRISGMTEARGTSSGDPNYTTTFLYNVRAQLTRLTHPDGTYIQYGYNPNGTLAWTADERHPGGATDPNQRTSYTYDDYKRLRTVTTPLRGTGDSTPRTTTYFYDQAGTAEDYTRMAEVPTKIVSPSGKITTCAYDANLRALSVTAVGDANVANATTTYTYDAVGNPTTVTDPNGNVTTYFYDQMNRLFAIDDAIPGHRASSTNHTVRYNFDPSGNKAQQIRVDDRLYQWQYDSFGRIQQTTGFLGETTGYYYAQSGDQAGNLSSMTDPAGKIYSYHYDALGRQDSMTYAVDASGATRSELYQYDIANHLWKYTNPAGQMKTLTYDNRGRLTNSSWSANGPSVTVAHDSTRPMSITSVEGGTTTTIGFGYDEANNLTYEDQSISGLPARRVQADSYADGSRKNLLVKTGGTVNLATYFDYTSRNELLNIYDGNNAPFFKYSYDANGNVTQRLGQRLHDTTVMQYDALNRPIVSAQNGLNGANFATSHYEYTKAGNLRDTYRDEEGGKGDWFDYDDMNQLTTAKYSATNVTSNPTSPAKTVSYALGARNRNSMTVIDNVANTTITTNYAHSDLNQYTTINGAALQYDNNFNLTSYNGWTYTYSAENRLMSVTGNGHSANFVYDAVGRCVRRTIDGVTTVFTYDQWTPIVEWDGSGNLIATNVYGLGDDEILYRQSGSTQFFAKSDPMGNVKFLLDGSGNGIEKYSYDAFGQPTITDWSGIARSTSAFGNRFMFSGREFFSSLGLYDLRNRVYDPVIGRFYQTDPIGFQGDPSNLYRFCGHNPLLGGDPSGLDGVFDDISIALGSFTATLTSVSNSISNWLRDNNINVGGGDSHSSGGGSDVNSDPLGVAGDSQVGTDYFGGEFGWSYYATASSAGAASVNSTSATRSYAPTETSHAFVKPTSIQSSPALGSVSNPIHIGDANLFPILNNVYASVHAANLQNVSFKQWAEHMRTLNTAEFYNPNYYSYHGVLKELTGTFSGHEINYLAVGMGYAARGWSMGEMEWHPIFGVYAWKDAQFIWNGLSSSRWSRLPYSGMRGGEVLWAELGWVYYYNGGHL